MLHFMQTRTLNTLKFAGALAVLVTLAACGGGGSPEPIASAPAPAPIGGGSAGQSPAPAPAPTPAPDPAPTGVDNTPVAGSISSSGNLQTSVPAPTYPRTSQQFDAFTTLNTVRAAAGAGKVAQSFPIDLASQAHADYVQTNIATLTDWHAEQPSKPDFYAQTVGERLSKAGYDVFYATEVIGGTGASLKASDCVYGLLNTVYHAAAILGQAFDVGIGIAADAANIPLCVIDFGHTMSWTDGQVPGSGKFVSYPYAGQAGVEYTSYLGNEIPRVSISLVPSATAGTPVIVSMHNADFVNAQGTAQFDPKIKTLQLSGPAGVVPAVIVAEPKIKSAGAQLNADGALPSGTAVLIPLSPLTANTTYTVTFDATITTKGNQVGGTWNFKTKP